MVSGVEWAGAQLPEMRNTASESLLRSALIGQAAGEQKRKAKTEVSVDALRQKALDFYKAGDRSAMMYTISEMARYDPDAATKFKDTFADLDRTNAFNGAMYLYTAAASDTPDAQQTALQKSLESLNVGPTHPYSVALQDIMKMPFGKERDDAMIKGLEEAQAAGLLPTKEEMFQTKGSKAGGVSALDIAKYNLDLKKFGLQVENAIQENRNKQIDNARLEDSLNFDKQKWETSQTKLTPQQEKYYADSADLYENSLGLSQSMFKLADEFDAYQREEEKKGGVGITRGQEIRNRLGWKGEGGTGGFAHSVGRFFRNFLGWQDSKIDAMYQEYDHIRSSYALENLPKGPASDADIIFALKGTPPANAGAGYIAQWLRGFAKLKAIDAARAKAKTDYIQKNLKVSGYLDDWEKNKSQYIATALNKPEWVDENPRTADIPPTLGTTSQSGAIPTGTNPQLPAVSDDIRSKILSLPSEQQSDILRRWQVAQKLAIEAGLATPENVKQVVGLNPGTLEFGIRGPNGKFAQIDTRQ